MNKGIIINVVLGLLAYDILGVIKRVILRVYFKYNPDKAEKLIEYLEK